MVENVRFYGFQLIVHHRILQDVVIFCFVVLLNIQNSVFIAH